MFTVKDGFFTLMNCLCFANEWYSQHDFFVKGKVQITGIIFEEKADIDIDLKIKTKHVTVSLVSILAAQ